MHKLILPLTIASMAFIASCSTLDKASVHGFNSGYYKLNDGKVKEKVYVNVSDEKIDVHHQIENIPDKVPFLSIAYNSPDSFSVRPIKFSKKSLDIDITSILLKYRPAIYGLPQQLTTDLNIAFYAGWRHDQYKITTMKDPLGNRYSKISSLGYDFGIFAGPGTTPVNPYTTLNIIDYDYSGMIMQTGFAGFLESDMASFGVAVGWDYLLNRDRNDWIYQNKPWIGFIVGVALY